MNYTLADIKKLREETGATILDCKNALVQAQTWDEAVKLLAAKSESKVERVKATFGCQNASGWGNRRGE